MPRTSGMRKSNHSRLKFPLLNQLKTKKKVSLGEYPQSLRMPHVFGSRPCKAFIRNPNEDSYLRPCCSKVCNSLHTDQLRRIITALSDSGESGLFSYLWRFFILSTSKVISGWVLTCDSLYRAASVKGQTTR